MNENKQIISAIDIGTTKIIAIIGCRENDGKFRILGLGRSDSKGIRRGNVQNIEQATDSIRKAVQQAEQTAGLKMKKVVVGIAGQHIRSLKNTGYINRINQEVGITQVEVDSITEDQFHIAIEPGESILHIIPKVYTIDNETHTVNPIGYVGKRLEGIFNIIIGKTTAINYIKTCISNLEIEILEMFLEPLASSRAVLTEDEMEVGIGMIDIGGGTSDLAIYHNNMLCHTAVIPFGGNVVTYDIREGLGLLERTAEQLKVKHGSALAETASNDIIAIQGISGREPKEIEMKLLANIIQARMEEIIGCLEFQIENSGLAQKLSAGLVITGGGSLLKNLPQLFNFQTGYDIRIGRPIEHIASDSCDFINSPDYATSVGLMLLGYDYKKFDTTYTEPEVNTNVEEEIDEEETISSVNEERKDKNSIFKRFIENFSGIIKESDTEIK